MCFSHLRWDFVFQRPQHLLTRAARHYEVAFVEEPDFCPVDQPYLRHSKRGNVLVLTPGIPETARREDHNAIVRDLLDAWLGSRRPDVLWYYTPQALGFSEHLTSRTIVYDNMDELSAFLGAPPELLLWEDALFGRADLVFTGGRSLFEAKKNRHAAVHCFPSSIDVAHFDAARRPQPDPSDQAGIPHPRIGFFGVIDERMDVGLVERLAQLKPEWHFVLVGPTCKIDPGTLPKAANLHWLGPKAYAELPGYLHGWDAGFMPFAMNESTRFISPTKTPEFLAAGLPVVSSPVPDVVHPYGDEGLIDIASGAEEFKERLDVLLAANRKEWAVRVETFLSSMSWDRTWEAMLSLIEEHAASCRQPAARRVDLAHV
jgi:glycosyltransferase involved in cell wall biosynthesis